jgi:predicted ABC-type transport system involved in lysophospholipase L1 biosynthesis ATPase subunit
MTPAPAAILQVRAVSRRFDRTLGARGPPDLQVVRERLRHHPRARRAAARARCCGSSPGLDQPTAGEVLLDGRRIEAPGADRGMVFQSYTLFPWLTVLDNVCFGLRERGIARAGQLEIANGFIAKVGLVGFEHHFPKQLSGGMQQRTAIARALANGPRILLMDEPFGALDHQTRELMQELLLGIWEAEKKTVLFVTHDIDEAGLHGFARRRDERAAGADQARPAGADRASAPLLGEDDRALQRDQGRADRAGEGGGPGGAGRLTLPIDAGAW